MTADPIPPTEAWAADGNRQLPTPEPLTTLESLQAAARRLLAELSNDHRSGLPNSPYVESASERLREAIAASVRRPHDEPT